MATIREIADLLGAGGEDVILLAGGSPDRPVTGAAALSSAGPDTMTFVRHSARSQSLLAGTKALLLIADRGGFDRAMLAANDAVRAVILSDNPRLAFMRVVDRFFAPPRPSGIHPSAVISERATIAAGVAIGPLCTIGDDVIIGAGTILHAGVHVYRGVTIGQNVIIHSGTAIGADGFGYERDDDGSFVKFPHNGTVEIEDDVEIGSNTSIDRGALGATRIGRGAKIDNLVHIAHNVDIGPHTAVIAHAMIGGSTRIGAYSWIAPSACIREQIVVGDRTLVGLASLVTRDIPSGETVMGSPARELREYRALVRRLSELVGHER